MRVALILLGLFLAVPALAQQRPPSFTLYFDLGSAQPGPAARQIAERAVAAARQREAEGRFDHVKVIGYADTVGTASAAQALSEQRAEAVKRLLVESGIPAAKINTEGRGKRSLAVATGDQVREVRNRRARIVIYAPGE